MKKRILSMILAVCMLLGLLVTAGGLTLPANAADGITVKFYYNRPDGNYENWSLWIWDPDGTSEIPTPTALVEENGKMVGTVQVKTGTTRLGYIVRLGNWEQKDIDEDQFVEIAGVLSGTIHVYIESGVKGCTVEFGDDVVEGITVVASRYTTENRRIQIKLSKAIETADTNTFIIKDSSQTYPVESVKLVGQFAYLIVPELDITKTHWIVYEDMEYEIKMPDFYAEESFESAYTYTGDDLGATYTSERTTLKVWAPTAVEMHVNLYTNGDPAAQAEPVEQVPMVKDVNGTWVVTLEGDRNGTYYTYQVTLDNEVAEACDPYARTTGVNGHRAMIIDLDATDPEGWENDKDPHYDAKFTDAVIYELHVRDLSSDSSSGIQNVGKYLGLIETGTTNGNGVATGLDHIKDLGITHVHLLPVYDFGSVDETGTGSQFNWGYDPVNYNVPEGSYSTDPYNGAVRVQEFKQMVKGLHDNGLSVIMDVVYNHVQNANSFCFNQIVPDYFSRPGSNGSGCGNDTASERAMVSKYIVDSVKYWADEYHIDGFRFDLVGLIDTDTINAIMEEVHKTHPNVKFYGEGWTMSTTPTKTGYAMTTQTNASKVPGFAFFSDTIRNLIKGNTYGGVSAGYISGATASSSQLAEVFKGMPSWCPSPSQSINYISCHDNNTLYDHITMVASNATEAQRIQMNKLGAAFYITAQGVPFMQAGEEFLRSKPKGDGTFDENSYSSSDAINSLKWNDLEKEAYQNVYNYYKGLIAFRKAHPALRLSTFAEVDQAVEVIDGLNANVAAYKITGGINGETAKALYVVFNANQSEQSVTLPAGSWNIYVDGDKAGTEILGSVSGTAKVAPLSALILVQEDAVAPDTQPTEPGTSGGDSTTEPTKTPWGLIAGAIASCAAGAAITAIVLNKKKKEENG